MEPVVPTAQNPNPRKRWWTQPGFLGVSIALHLILGAGATVWIVARNAPPRALAFRGGPPSPNKTQRNLEHQVKMQKREQRQTPPAAPPDRRIVVSGLTKVSLPPMPPLPPAATNQPRSLLGGMANAGGFGQMSGGGAAGSGTMTKLGAGGGIGAGGPPVNFFGIRDAGAASIVIMIDVSDSMFTRTGDAEGRKLAKTGKEQSFQTVRDEAAKLVGSLSPSTRFGIVRWSGGAYSWRPELAPATEANKAEALAHIQDGVDMKTARPQGGRPGGTRHDYALELAFSLRPEVIYMLTDGNATAAQPGGGLSPIPAEEIWRAAEAGQKAAGAAPGAKRTRLHVVYYLTGGDRDDERAMLTALASRNGGQFRTVQAKGRKP